MTSIKSVARHIIRYRAGKGAPTFYVLERSRRPISSQWVLIAAPIAILATQQTWTSCSIAEWLLNNNNTGISYCEMWLA